METLYVESHAPRQAQFYIIRRISSSGILPSWICAPEWHEKAIAVLETFARTGTHG